MPMPLDPMEFYYLTEALKRIEELLERIANRLDHYYPEPQEEHSATSSSSDEDAAEPTDR